MSSGYGLFWWRVAGERIFEACERQRENAALGTEFALWQRLAEVEEGWDLGVGVCS